MGKCDKDDAFKVMDAFIDLGGNFLDTANNYQNDESEEWVGEWMESRGVRDQMVYVSLWTSFFEIITHPVPGSRPNILPATAPTVDLSSQFSRTLWVTLQRV